MGLAELHPRAGQNCHHFTTFRDKQEAKTQLRLPSSPACHVLVAVLAGTNSLLPLQRLRAGRGTPKYSPRCQGCKTWLNTGLQRRCIPDSVWPGSLAPRCPWIGCEQEGCVRLPGLLLCTLGVDSLTLTPVLTKIPCTSAGHQMRGTWVPESVPGVELDHPFPEPLQKREICFSF